MKIFLLMSLLSTTEPSTAPDGGTPACKLPKKSVCEECKEVCSNGVRSCGYAGPYGTTTCECK